MAIPHIILIYGYTIAFFIAWFALLFTGRWPDGLYRFVSGYLRDITRVAAYLYLGTGAYPPVGGRRPAGAQS